jgi:ABC-type hemin transport system substrate-binding protein
MKAGAALMDAGKANELIALLQAFGVQAVTLLKPEQLGAFATELRKLGAQI